MTKAKVINKNSKYYGKVVNVKKLEDTRFFANRYGMVYGNGVFFGDELDFNFEEHEKNIDDAAWLYYLKTYGIDNIAISEDIRKAYKAGAEWMMNRGKK